MTPKASKPETAGALLAWARGQLDRTSESARLDAEVLLGHTLEANRAALFANPDKPVSARQSALFTELIAARKRGRPVAQLTGEREFWSLPLHVNNQVLVPRPETELLVERALAYIPADAACKILDLGTGSGAIAIAIASERPHCVLTASDNSAAAISIAQLNGQRLVPERIEFLRSNWFASLEHRQFDLIVSNPPYVGESETALTDPELNFEPREALYSGADGLDDIRRIIADSPTMLGNDGHLLLEHGYTQAEAIRQLMQDAGLTAIQSHADLAGIIRVTEGRLGASA